MATAIGFNLNISKFHRGSLQLAAASPPMGERGQHKTNDSAEYRRCPRLEPAWNTSVVNPRTMRDCADGLVRSVWCCNLAGEACAQLSQQSALNTGLGMRRMFVLRGRRMAVKMRKLVNVARLLSDQQANDDEQRLQRTLQPQLSCETGSATTIR